MTGSNTPDDHARDRSTDDPEGLGGADTGAGAGNLGGTGAGDLGGTGSAPAWAALAAPVIRVGRATSGAAALPGRRPATLRVPRPPRPAGRATSAMRPVMSDGRGRSRTPIRLPDGGVAASGGQPAGCGRLSVRKVMEWRSALVGGMECCQADRAAPASR
jgi:hypothetical protein